LNTRFLSPARKELSEAITYYENQRQGLGFEFRDEVFAAVERIKKLPNAWRELSPNTRRHRIQRFPYGVIYAIDGNDLLIIAVAHAHRNPDYWRQRTE
jgi:toxin ParE2